MIVKTKKGYQVKSEDGSKNLSANDLTKEEAEERLRQVEYFKHKKKSVLHIIELTKSGKKNLSKLHKKKVVDKKGKITTVWVKGLDLPSSKKPLKDRIKIYEKQLDENVSSGKVCRKIMDLIESKDKEAFIQMAIDGSFGWETKRSNQLYDLFRDFKNVLLAKKERQRKIINSIFVESWAESSRCESAQLMQYCVGHVFKTKNKYLYDTHNQNSISDMAKWLEGTQLFNTICDVIKQTYKNTQKSLKKKDIILLRGVEKRYTSHALMESWTTDVETANDFDGHGCMKRVVPKEDIFVYYKAPDWHGNKSESEYIVINRDTHPKGLQYD